MLKLEPNKRDPEVGGVAAQPGLHVFEGFALVDAEPVQVRFTDSRGV